MFHLRSIKTHLILYLAVCAGALAVRDRDGAFVLSLAIAVVSAVALETGILYFKTKKVQFTESSVITGLITGFVLSSDELWWKCVFAAAAAILSKYLIRLRGKHIFNPAALGIFLSTVILGAGTQWKGTYLWYIVVPCGLYFAYALRKTGVVIGYALVSFLLFGTQALLQKVAPWHLFGYLSYFYIFVMVIEPKTSPAKKAEQYAFGAGIAALIFILTAAGSRFDVELFSLLVMNAALPLSRVLTLKGGTT